MVKARFSSPPLVFFVVAFEVIAATSVLTGDEDSFSDHLVTDVADSHMIVFRFSTPLVSCRKASVMIPYFRFPGWCGIYRRLVLRDYLPTFFATDPISSFHVLSTPDHCLAWHREFSSRHSIFLYSIVSRWSHF